MRRKSKKQAGDTIVEVLIAITVVSLVLTAAFVVSNRSTNGVQNSQDHANAQQILQSQIEQTRTVLQNDDSGTTLAAITSVPKFCMSGTTVITAYSQSACSSGFYTYQATPAGTNTYKFSITWDQLGGGTATEDMYYRIYSKSSTAVSTPITAVTPSVPGVPECPANVTTTLANSGTRVVVSFSASPRATLYKIYRNNVLMTSQSSTASWNDNGVGYSTTYTYRVTAENAGGASTGTCSSTITTPAAPTPTYVTLYRCWNVREYFETLDSNCEGTGTLFRYALGKIISPSSPYIPADSKRIDRYYTWTRSSLWYNPTIDHLTIATTGPAGSGMPWASSGYVLEGTLGYSSPSAGGWRLSRCFDAITGDNYQWYPDFFACTSGAYTNDGYSDYHVQPVSPQIF